jgi:hypothetical protein
MPIVHLEIYVWWMISVLDFIGSEFGDGRPSGHQPTGLDSPSSRFDMGPSPSAVGGLSVTGCLADFSVYIFHPYGGGKKSGKFPLPP